MKPRKVLEKFEAYGWETPTYEIADKVGLREDQVVRLDTNTSPFRPKLALSSLAKHLKVADVNEYPDTSYHGLTKALSDYTGKGLDRFVITNGADEGLDITTKVLLDPGDEVIIPTPTYSMYRITSQIMGARVRQVQRKKDFSLDIDAMLRAVTKRTKLIFLCNPNNPTGNFSAESEVEKLAKESGAVVAVDEAYFEYCGGSAVDITDRLEDVVVCRTLSKAFSLAGARLGYLIAKRETVQKLNLVRPPNSVSVLTLMLGQTALTKLGEMKHHVETTVKERTRLQKALKDVSGIEPFDSVTNFILFRLAKGNDADEIHARLMKKGLVLRNLSKVKGVENCLRTTVGLPEVNDRLVSELETLVRK
jgi:histidinol-phosphate aminotransferase